MKRLFPILLISLATFGFTITGGNLIGVTTDNIAWTWIDHFTNQNARWDWDYGTGTGYHTCPTSVDGRTNTIAEIGITDETTSGAYSDSSLHEPSNSHAAPATVQANIRCNVADISGTCGFGFYNGNFSVPTAAWFWFGGAGNYSSWAGFRVMVITSGTVRLNEAIASPPSLSDWHTYKIRMVGTTIDFYIDGVSVYSYTGTVPSGDMRVEIWNDNAVYNVAHVQSFVAVNRTECMYIDYCSYLD